MKALKIQELDLTQPQSLAKFQHILAKVQRQFKPVTEPILESRKLTATDFAKRITL